MFKVLYVDDFGQKFIMTVNDESEVKFLKERFEEIEILKNF